MIQFKFWLLSTPPLLFSSFQNLSKRLLETTVVVDRKENNLCLFFYLYPVYQA